jgi:hypothetical protein
VCVSPSLPLSLSNVLVSSLSQPRSNCFNFSGGGSSMLRIPHPRAGKWRRAATLLSPAAAEPVLPPLAQLTVEQSVAWLGTVSGLAPDAIEAAGRSFTANEIDGEELETIRPKLLRSSLKGCLPEAKARDAAIAAILGRRDEQLVEESTPEDSMVCSLSLCLMEDPWTTQVGSTCE